MGQIEQQATTPEPDYPDGRCVPVTTPVYYDDDGYMRCRQCDGIVVPVCESKWRNLNAESVRLREEITRLKAEILNR